MPMEKALPGNGVYSGPPMGMPPPEQDYDVVVDENVPMDPLAIPESDPADQHGANLAEFIPDNDLSVLATNLIADFDADKNSREAWEQTYVKGLDLLGLRIEDRTEPWAGACGVHHPMLAEAVVRFQAQAIMEIFPASGPAKTEIFGRPTPEKEKQAERMKEELNYLLTEKMTEYRSEMESMLFQLPLAGSAFKKIYYNEAYGRPAAMFVPAEDFVVPYGTSDLQACPRYTHVQRSYPNEIRKLQVSGFYRDVQLPQPAPNITNTQEKKDKLIGSSNPGVQFDPRHTLLEMHVELDLKGFEDPDGIALPYVVTIEKSSAKVLSIRRNWAQEDGLKRRQQFFIQYNYLPGFGFYGTGLIHLIGGLARSSTSILRQLVDAGTLSNLPAGLKSRGLRIKGDDSPIMPGEFRDVDIPSGKISDNITFLPYKEPSSVLYQLLGNLVDEGRRISSIADLPIGEGNSQAPVGTTLALMERAMKVMSAVQARLHASLRRELSLICDVVRDFMPEAYEYEVQEGSSRAGDFDRDLVDIVPVSDANASTMSQRVVQYQAALQLSSQAPAMYDMPELHRQVLATLGIENIELIIPSTKDKKPVDPISENMDILTGKPVKAFIYQDHEAHIAVHLAAAQDPKIMELVGQSPMASQIMSAAAAHVMEHISFQYRREIEKQMGVALPPPEEPLPEDVEVQVSRLGAEAAARLLKKDLQEKAAEEAQKAMEDPVIQMQKRELDIKELQAKMQAEKNMADLRLKEKELDLRILEAQSKIASQEKIAGAKLGAEKVMVEENMRLQRELADAKMQVDMAKVHAQHSSQERVAGAQMGTAMVTERIKDKRERDKAELQAKTARATKAKSTGSK